MPHMFFVFWNNREGQFYRFFNFTGIASKMTDKKILRTTKQQDLRNNKTTQRFSSQNISELARITKGSSHWSMNPQGSCRTNHFLILFQSFRNVVCHLLVDPGRKHVWSIKKHFHLIDCKFPINPPLLIIASLHMYHLVGSFQSDDGLHVLKMRKGVNT